MNNKANRNISKRLQEALDKRGMKAVDLCAATGVPKSAVSYYLAGKSSPKADRLYIICKALDVSEAWMLGYDVPQTRTERQKKNDQLAELIVRLRREPELLETVLCPAELPADSFESIKQLISVLREK